MLLKLLGTLNQNAMFQAKLVSDGSFAATEGGVLNIQPFEIKRSIEAATMLQLRLQEPLGEGEGGVGKDEEELGSELTRVLERNPLSRGHINLRVVMHPV